MISAPIDVMKVEKKIERWRQTMDGYDYATTEEEQLLLNFREACDLIDSMLTRLEELEAKVEAA